jgi:hypothetical protein
MKHPVRSFRNIRPIFKKGESHDINFGGWEDKLTGGTNSADGSVCRIWGIHDLSNIKHFV